jgi:hypothetical protein
MYITVAIVGAGRRRAARGARPASRRDADRSRAKCRAPTLCTCAARRTATVRRHWRAHAKNVPIH